MSRCKSCDVILTESDLRRKAPISGEYMDLCKRCSDVVIADLSEDMDEDHYKSNEFGCIHYETEDRSEDI